LHPYRRAMDPAGDAASPWLRHLHALEGDRGRAAAAAWEAREKRGGGGGGGGGTEKEGRWRQGRVWEREVGRTSDICHRLGPVGGQIGHGLCQHIMPPLLGNDLKYRVSTPFSTGC
jgi:hypothetical protein